MLPENDPSSRDPVVSRPELSSVEDSPGVDSANKLAGCLPGAETSRLSNHGYWKVEGSLARNARLVANHQLGEGPSFSSTVATSLDFAPDNLKLACASYNRTTSVLALNEKDSAQQELLAYQRTFGNGHPTPERIAFSADGEELFVHAVGNSKTPIGVYDLNRRNVFGLMKKLGHYDSSAYLNAACRAKESGLIAVVENNHVLRIIDGRDIPRRRFGSTTLEVLCEVKLNSHIESIKLDPTGERLAVFSTGSQGTELRLFRLADSKLSEESCFEFGRKCDLLDMTDELDRFAVRYDDHDLLQSIYVATFVIDQGDSGSQIRGDLAFEYGCKRDLVFSFSPGKKVFAIGGDNCRSEVYSLLDRDSNGNPILLAWYDTFGPVTSLAFSPEYDLLAVASYKHHFAGAEINVFSDPAIEIRRQTHFGSFKGFSSSVSPHRLIRKFFGA